MTAADIKTLFGAITDGIATLAKATTKEYVSEAKKDGQALVNAAKENILRWTALLAEGKLTTEDFEWLMFRQKDIVIMNALKQAGLAQIRIEGFKQGVIGIVIDSVFSFLKI